MDAQNRRALRTCFDDFLLAKRQAGCCALTVAQYRWHGENLIDWLEGEGVTCIDAVERSLLRRWGAGLYDAWKPSTAKVATVTARSWFRWCVDEGYLGESPAAALKLPKVLPTVAPVARDEEVEALLAVCDMTTVKGRRDAAMVSIFYGTAMRRRELISLRMDRLYLARGYAVVERKRGYEDEVALDAVVLADLALWLEVRPQVVAAGVLAVFVSVGGSTPGQALTGDGVGTILKKLSAKAGVKASSHAMRRGWSEKMALMRAPRGPVLRQAGWRDGRMYEHYTRMIEVQELARNYSTMRGLRRNGNGNMEEEDKND